MHPAYSIIAFTTLSGLGYGLAVFLGLGFLDPSLVSTKIAHLLALTLIAIGLLLSTLHLGNPQRAWRALSQWRSSWLSREGVMAIATFIPLTLNAAFCLFTDSQSLLLGLVGAVGALITVYCTSMIYASLRSVQAWHTPLTPFCYLLFSLAGGFLLGSLFLAVAGTATGLVSSLSGMILAAAFFVKLQWRNRMLTMEPLSTPETATGLGHIGKVRLLERPHALDNYLTREMGFKVARKHSQKLWKIAVLLGGFVPLSGLFASILIENTGASMVLLTISVIAHVIGMLSERWLFFAEAKHAVMNYY